MSDRFITPGALPPEHERELLTVMIEECSEVQQRATKILRFGRDEVQPGQALTNMDRLSDEIGDLMAMFERLTARGFINASRVEESAALKHIKLAKYLQTDPT